jgi:phage-related protein
MGQGPMKRLVSRFYRTESGNMPVRDWLVGLLQSDRRIVGIDIATVEFGWPIGMPICRPLQKIGLREIRSTIRGGKVEARVVFGINGSEMILVHGFEKSPSTQDHEIKIAQDRWRDFKRRLEK